MADLHTHETETQATKTVTIWHSLIDSTPKPLREYQPKLPSTWQGHAPLITGCAAILPIMMTRHNQFTTPAKVPSLLSIRQLSERLGVCPQTIRNWTKDGAITPTLKRGRVVRYDWQQVTKDLQIQSRSPLHHAFEEVPQ